MSSVFCPDRQVPLVPLSLNNNCPSTASFQSSIQVNSTFIEQNVSIQENLNVAISIKNDCDFQHSNSKHMAWWFPKETSQIALSISISNKLQLSSRNYLLQGINNLNSNFVWSALTDMVEDRQFFWNLQSSFVEPPSLCKL